MILGDSQQISNFSVILLKIIDAKQMLYRAAILWLMLLAVLSWGVPVKAEESNVDSLVSVLHSRRYDDCDTAKFNLIEEIAASYAYLNIDSSLYYAQMLYDEAKRCGDAKSIMKGCNRLDYSLYYLGKYDLCCDYCFEGLSIADSVGDKRMMASFYYSLGSGYGTRGNSALADEYWNKSYNLYGQLQDTSQMVAIMNNIAINALNNDMFDVADSYTDSTIILSKRINNRIKLSQSYFIKGGVLASIYDFEKLQDNVDLLTRSNDYFYISRNISLSLSDHFDVANSDIYIVQNYVELSKAQTFRAKDLLDSCKILLDEAYRICVRNGFDSLLDMYKNSRLGWLVKTHQYHEAKVYLDSLFVEYSADIENHGFEIEDTYNWYAELYSEMKNYKEAYINSKKYHQWYRKNRNNDFAAKSATNMAQTRFNLQMQAREQEALARELQYEANSQKQLIILIASIIILLILAYSFWQSKKAYRMLDDKNVELEQQKKEILTVNENLEQQRDLLHKVNSQITDSINYASLIQNAALPSAKYLSKILGEHFVFFRPKDIVSGDFYWAHEGANRKLIVVADSTGHGVPGGFISMLGISFLNEIVARFHISNDFQNVLKEDDTISASKFLDELRNMLREALHQYSEEADNGDGMDLALVIIDNKTKTLHYAGAYRPLYIYHEGQIRKIDADRMHIGGDVSADLKFTNHEIPLSTGDMIYLFSDGIVDQFGYDEYLEKEVKFTSRRLQALLDEINMLPCSEQLVRLQNTIDNWRRVGTGKESEQTDDNIMVGIRI